MAPKKKPSKGKERPPPVDMLIKPAIGIALALLAYQFISGIKSEISRVNVEDELELRDVFFGEGDGKNYAILCHPEDAKYPISSVFQDASSDGSAGATFKVMDCDHVLSGSEKTVIQRFNLNTKNRPTIFVSGKVGSPKQVPTKHLKTGSMLVKALRNLMEPKAIKLETTQDLRTKCLDKDICGLLLKGSKSSPKYVKDAMAKLLIEYPKVAFAAIDTSVLYVKGLEAEYLPELANGQPRFVVFQKANDPKKPDRLKTSLAALPTNGIGYGPMSNLVAGVVQKTQEMSKVTSLPIVKTRTKKLEEEERQKRVRRLDQQQRQHDGSSSSGGGSGSGSGSGGSSGGHFSNTANDGSKDGRKAERDRRRQEHQKNNPDYKEKTPEEKAEMERQRRKRMEEEGAKWNMAADDLPPEGDPVDDEGYDMDDDSMDFDNDDNDNSGFDDEGDDVMDLD